MQAEEAVRHETFPIYASDLDPACVALCRENAEKAGVAHTIAITRKDARKAEIGEKTMLLTNPPYGERLLDMESARRLYADFGKRLAQNPAKQYILSSDEEFETYFGALADKKRKLYNGMIKCNLFMYFKDISFRKYTR